MTWPRGNSGACACGFPATASLPDKEITEDSPEFKKRSHYAELPFCGGFQGVEPVEPADFDRCFQEAAQAWRQRLARGMTIRVPEPRVNDAYRAWLAYLFTNVDKEGERYFPHDGSGFYELVWGIAAIQSCRAFDMYGYPAEAQKYLDSICTLVRPDGELKTAFGLSDSGTLLVALEDHYRYTHDKAWLGRRGRHDRAGCELVDRPAGQGKGGADARRGQLRHDQVSAQRRLSGARLQLLVGHRAVHGAGGGGTLPARPSGARPTRGAWPPRRPPIARTSKRPCGGPCSSTKASGCCRSCPPRGPGWSGPSYGSTGYYSLFASLILDNEFLPANDPHAALLVERLGATRRAVRGHVHVLRLHRPRLHLRLLARNAQTRASRRRRSSGCTARWPTGCRGARTAAWNARDIQTAPTRATLPHLRSGTQQLRLLRMMLVREEGDRLILAQAAPQHWLKQGQRVEVQNAPTMFGPVSYTIQSAVDQGRITVQLAPPSRNPPQEIQLFVRHPEGRPIQQVLVDGKPLDGFDAGSVTLRNLREPLTLELRYATK